MRHPRQISYIPDILSIFAVCLYCINGTSVHNATLCKKLFQN